MLRVAICQTPPESDRLAERLRDCAASGNSLAVECYGTAAELKKTLRREPGRYRLVLMDTVVGEEDGIAAAIELRHMGCLCDIAFCGDSPERALEAFDAYPTAWLTKEPTAESLCRLLTFVAERSGKRPTIILNGENGRKNGFATDSIIYIEVFRTELEVHTTGGRTTCIGSLRETFEKLPAARFYRAHRSFIVNLSRVTGISKYQFTMDNGDVVTVAKNRYAEAKKAYRAFHGE